MQPPALRRVDLDAKRGRQVCPDVGLGETALPQQRTMISVTRLSTGKKVSGGFALTFLILAVLGIVQFRTIQDLIETSHWATHSTAVIAEIEAALAALAEANAARRGYLITHQQNYLRSYATAENETGRRVRTIRRLTADNPRQQRRLDALEPLIARRFAESQGFLSAARAPRGSGEIKQLERMEDVPLMTQIRAMISEMVGEERRLFAERTAASEARARETLAASVLGVLVALVLVSLASGMIRRDLRARERAEAALEQRTAELVRSNRELEQFAYVASHDLQEPLRMISSYTQLLGQRYRGKLDSDADDFIAYAVDGARRMQALIQDLLAYSRLNTRRKPFAPIDCGAALDRALANLEAAIDESGAKVVRDPLPTVMADGPQLTQMFQNLIGNAIKYHAEATPQVHIGAARDSESWRFAIRDNGIGIEPQHRERIFAIFQRLHGRTDYPGNGIGLAICKKIAENHGGTIWVDSAPGQGSTFFFTLSTNHLANASVKPEAGLGTSVSGPQMNVDVHG